MRKVTRRKDEGRKTHWMQLSGTREHMLLRKIFDGEAKWICEQRPRRVRGMTKAYIHMPIGTIQHNCDQISNSDRKQEKK